jgi:uncharacterized iron-regulated protein
MYLMSCSSPLRRRRGPIALALLLSLALAGTAHPAHAAPAPRLWLFGEQHDQPDQQRQVAEQVARLAADGRLHALVIEMAARGGSTSALPPRADEAWVQAALDWPASGWSWERYAPVVMAAVRAGVPVLGGNLPRPQIASAMRDASLDGRVPEAARELLATAVREGHCNLLPESQVTPMLRVQIARDQSIADTVRGALAEAAPGKAVLLLAGAQHVARDRGVPLHLGPSAEPTRVVMFGMGPQPGGPDADEWRPALATPRPDPCEALRERFKPPG